VDSATELAWAIINGNPNTKTHGRLQVLAVPARSILDGIAETTTVSWHSSNIDDDTDVSSSSLSGIPPW
jgi:hypothetical protein